MTGLALSRDVIPTTGESVTWLHVPLDHDGLGEKLAIPLTDGECHRLAAMLIISAEGEN